jgi:hypothetical protein
VWIAGGKRLNQLSALVKRNRMPVPSRCGHQSPEVVGRTTPSRTAGPQPAERAKANVLQRADDQITHDHATTWHMAVIRTAPRPYPDSYAANAHAPHHTRRDRKERRTHTVIAATNEHVGRWSGSSSASVAPASCNPACSDLDRIERDQPG